MATSPHRTTKTILRIKRRRTDEPLPYIRLEGLLDRKKRPRGGDDDDDSCHSHGSSSSNQYRRNEVRRLEEEHLSDLLDSAHIQEGPLQQQQQQQQQGYHIPSSGNNVKIHPYKTSVVWRRLSLEGDKKRTTYRIVDALLEEDGRKTKRRKLTLIETSNGADFPSVVSVRRKTALKVLDPLSRLVDDSLQQVHAGTRRIMDHYRFVMTDPRLAYESKKWLAWCHSSGGNLLHACALWNDVEVTSELCHSNLVATLTEAVDGDDRTPYEVAQLSGHDSVCQVLEAFGGDTTNYVYDTFCLEENDEEEYEEQTMTVELKGGVGYWTPEGELVLEAPEKSPASLSHVFDEDGEIDSNCEEYGGNDYPEDEDWGEDFMPDQNNRDRQLDMCSEDENYEELSNGIKRTVYDRKFFAEREEL